MALTKHFYIVCFDIVSDKIRYRVVKILLKFGIRVQKSVFECFLDDAQFIELKTSIEAKISFAQDSVRYYHLCQRCEKNLQISGLGAINEREALIVI